MTEARPYYPDAAESLEAVTILFQSVSPAVIDYLKVREAELTKRAAISAIRDVEIEKIRNYTQMMLAAIEGTVTSRELLIAAVSEGLDSAIKAGNTEVALSLTKVLAGFGNMTTNVVEGYKALTGRPFVDYD